MDHRRALRSQANKLLGASDYEYGDSRCRYYHDSCRQRHRRWAKHLLHRALRRLDVVEVIEQLHPELTAVGTEKRPRNRGVPLTMEEWDAKLRRYIESYKPFRR